MSSKLGKICKVQHTQTYRNGSASMRKTSPTYVDIVMEYADGDVLVRNCNDLWKVKKSTDPRAQYETVN